MQRQGNEDPTKWAAGLAPPAPRNAQRERSQATQPDSSRPQPDRATHKERGARPGNLTPPDAARQLLELTP
jgi:hypothetical protein